MQPVKVTADWGVGVTLMQEARATGYFDAAKLDGSAGGGNSHLAVPRRQGEEMADNNGGPVGSVKSILVV